MFALNIAADGSFRGEIFRRLNPPFLVQDTEGFRRTNRSASITSHRTDYRDVVPFFFQLTRVKLNTTVCCECRRVNDLKQISRVRMDSWWWAIRNEWNCLMGMCGRWRKILINTISAYRMEIHVKMPNKTYNIVRMTHSHTH